jgi:hypothetical protein
MVNDLLKSAVFYAGNAPGTAFGAASSDFSVGGKTGKYACFLRSGQLRAALRSLGQPRHNSHLTPCARFRRPLHAARAWKMLVDTQSSNCAFPLADRCTLAGDSARRIVRDHLRKIIGFFLDFFRIFP